MPGVIVFLILIGATMAIGLAAVTHRTTIAQWTKAADALGIDIKPGSIFSLPRLNGLVSDRVVSVHTFQSSSGNNQQRYTRFEVTYPSIGLGLELSRQTKVSGFFRRMVGMQDVEIGDPAFDDAFVVKASDPHRLAVFLSGQRRTTLSRLLATYPTMKVTDTSVRVDVRKMIRDPEVLVSTVRRLVGVAQILSDPTEKIDNATTARAEGDLTEALRRMREAIDSQPENIDYRLDEIDTLSAAGREGEIGNRVDELGVLAPADPEVTGWKRSLGSKASTQVVSGESIDATAATQDLLGGRQLSFAVRDKFVANYAGGQVHWSGTVKSARAYETDHDFGRGPGVKAVVTVASLEHDLFGSTEVDAVVELPASGPVPQRGDSLTFSGTLTAVDPLMRNFTVRNAVPN